MRRTAAVTVSDLSQVGEARRSASEMTASLGFSATQAGKVALVINEAGRNLVLHAGGGQLVLQPVERDGQTGLEILALDKGPGMSSVERCLEDGYSTAGTPGTGLGAIARQSHEWDIYSAQGSGTALLSRIWASTSPPVTRQPFEVGVLSLPLAGEEVCGDSWAVECPQGRLLVLVADGLGHGPFAAEASSQAVRILHENAGLPLTEIIERAHSALRSTRGAAVAVALVDPDEGSVRFAGVGNISGDLITGDRGQSLVSHNGTVGHQMRKVQEFVYPWSAGALLIMCSDGLGTQWRLSRYPGLDRRDPALVAGVLYRDFTRGRDDVTVLVARAGRGS